MIKGQPQQQSRMEGWDEGSPSLNGFKQAPLSAFAVCPPSSFAAKAISSFTYPCYYKKITS